MREQGEKVNYQCAHFFAIDFCVLNKEWLLKILALRNAPEIAQFMYSSHISEQGHFDFVQGLHNNASAKYWAFFELVDSAKSLATLENLARVFSQSPLLLKDENTQSVPPLDSLKFLGVGSLSRLNLTHKHAYVGIYANIFESTLAKKGTKILKMLEKIALSSFNLHALFLEVMSKNSKARAFYLRNGYKLSGVLKDFLCRDSQSFDVDIMRKSLILRESMASVCVLQTNIPKISLFKSQTPQKPLLVAELSANHSGSLEVAKDSFQAIAKSGAKAVKLQTYTPDCLTLNAKNKYFQIKGSPWEGQYLYDLYKEAQTPWEWHKELFKLGKELGLLVFSSPFSPKGVEFLESLGCPMYKIASFEVLDLELIAEVARCKKPVILSSGIANDEEIALALEMCYKYGAYDITLLHCVSSYPAPLDSMNLAQMPRIKEKFGVKFGLSDHTLDTLCACIATSLGASVIEKHFILDKSLQSVDSSFSLDVRGFTELSKVIDETFCALGNGVDSDAPKKGREFARGIWVSEEIKKGAILTRQNIKILRPNIEGGLHPRSYSEILGCKATRDLHFGEPLREGDFTH